MISTLVEFAVFMGLGMFFVSALIFGIVVTVALWDWLQDRRRSRARMVDEQALVAELEAIPTLRVWHD